MLAFHFCREKGGLTIPGVAPQGVDEQHITATGWLGSAIRRKYMREHMENEILPACRTALIKMFVQVLATDEYDHLRTSGLLPATAGT